MKFNLYITLLLSLLLLVVCPAGGSGQVVVTAHVTAEVVESVSATARVVTGFDLENSPSGGGDPVKVDADLSLGTLIIHSGRDIACAVVMKPAFLSDSQENPFTVETGFTLQKNAASAPGTHTLQISGRARSGKEVSPGLYAGTYTMVIAYN